MQSPTLLFIALLLSHLLYGFIFACFLADDDEEVLALCLPSSFALFAYCTLPSLLLGIDFYPYSQLLAIGLLIVFVLIQTTRTSPIKVIFSRLESIVHYFKSNLGLFWGYFFILVNLYAHQVLVPFYGLGSLPGDWFGHYRITHEFFTHSVPEFPMRLPLFQMLQVFVLSGLNPEPIFGRDFYQFQIIQLVVGFSIFPVVKLLFSRIFGQKRSLAILLASALLPYVFIQSLYTWPKMLASTFSLLAFYYYLNLKNDPNSRQDLLLCGLFNGLSIVSHWLGLVYLVSMVIDFGWHNLSASSRRNRILFMTLFKLALTVLLLLAPFYIWGFLKFGIGDTFLANWSLLEKSEYSLVEGLSIRVMNFFTTLFLPLSILIGLFREFPKHGFTELGGIDLLARSFSWHFGSILGNLSLTATTFLIFRSWQRLKTFRNKNPLAIWKEIRSGCHQLVLAEPSLVIYTTGGILLLVMVQSYPLTFGVSLSGLVPSVFLIFGFILSRVFGHEQLKYLSVFLFLESMLFIWTWQGMLHYLDANYVVQVQTSDPALMLLNEVIRYKRELNLNFLGGATNFNRNLLIPAAIMSEIGILTITIRAIRGASFSHVGGGQ